MEAIKMSKEYNWEKYILIKPFSMNGNLSDNGYFSHVLKIYFIDTTLYENKFFAVFDTNEPMLPWYITTKRMQNFVKIKN
jgi:hypothetical protein